jgi:hypothetical protein
MVDGCARLAYSYKLYFLYLTLRFGAAFNRDAATRRSKARADLKAQTAWSDEQIEGWKSMLDRDVRPLHLHFLPCIYSCYSPVANPKFEKNTSSRGTSLHSRQLLSMTLRAVSPKSLSPAHDLAHICGIIRSRKRWRTWAWR